MTQRSTTLRGVVRGKTIVLVGEPGFPDGQEVSVTVEAVGGPSPSSALPQTDAERRWVEARARVENLKPGEGLALSFGAWAGDADDLDEYLEMNRQRRKAARPGIEP